MKIEKAFVKVSFELLSSTFVKTEATLERKWQDQQLLITQSRNCATVYKY